MIVHPPIIAGLSLPLFEGNRLLAQKRGGDTEPAVLCVNHVAERGVDFIP